MRVSLNLLGSLLIDVDGRQLDARFLGVAGNVLDHFQIVKGPAIADQDGDGIDDAADNCLVLANLLQLDSDADGYGNRCDADFDGNGRVGASDYGALAVAFGSVPSDPNWNPDVDMSGNGAVGASDYGLFVGAFGSAPGPSGLACAGTPPCPAP